LSLPGLFFDVVVYTIWLKRRTPWSIIWGGVSGGMPALAGRALGTGQIEWVGVALALAVLFWIPTHIMTFSLRYREDYAAGGRTHLSRRRTACERATRLIIAISSVLAALMVALLCFRHRADHWLFAPDGSLVGGLAAAGDSQFHHVRQSGSTLACSSMPRCICSVPCCCLYSLFRGRSFLDLSLRRLD
jgi:heme O synthase-like polyprenyltransferase